ncbi:hypothetical protein CN947_28495 [Bacillus cereus]|nr:hypothetical protein CN947_28495 [Bacillus cereus]
MASSLLTDIVYAINTYAYTQSSEGMRENAELGLDLPLAWQIGTGFIMGVIGAIIGLFISTTIYKALMMFIGNDTPYKASPYQKKKIVRLDTI